MEHENTEMDFDSTDTGATDNHESTASEVDQVTALLLEGEDLDELERHERDNAKTKIYNSDGSEKTNTKTWTSTPVDRHGNREFGGSDSAPVKQAPEREPTVFGAQTEYREREAQLSKAFEDINAHRQTAQAHYEAGNLTYEQFQAAEYQMGVQFGQLRDAAYQHQLEGYQLKDHQRDSHEWLHSTIGDDWSPENRHETAKQAQEWLASMDIDETLMAEVDDPRVAGAIIKSMRAMQRDDSQRAEIESLKAQVRRLKGEGKIKRERSRKASSVGSKRDQDWQINEVVKLLGGGE